MSFQLLVFDSRRGNKEGEEEDKLLGFYPDATPLDERISLAGLLQGLHTFRQSLQRQTTEKFEIIETDASVWTIHEAEPNIFLALVAIKNWLPRHVSQDTMMACLVHTHHLMNILFAGIQHELDKDASATIARASVTNVINSIGSELNNSSSWLSRELRNPLTTMGHYSTFTLPLPITLDIHSLCHRLLSVSYKGEWVMDGCALMFTKSVLWSCLPVSDTNGLASLVRSTLLPLTPSSGNYSSATATATTTTGLSPRLGALTPRGTPPPAPPPSSPIPSPTPPSSKPTSSSEGQLVQLSNGFYVLKESPSTGGGGGSREEEEYGLPHVFLSGTQKHVLLYGRGDLLILMPITPSTISQQALSLLQTTIETIIAQILTALAQETHAQGGELGHVAGWRYRAQIDPGSGVQATPRSKISAMSHHARALATTVNDSLSRLGTDADIEISARSTQGVWAAAEVGRPRGRTSVVIREKKLDGDAAQCVARIDFSLQNELKLV